MKNLVDTAPVAPDELGLDKAVRGHSYRIVSSSALGKSRLRMDSLGLVSGEVVHVLFSNYAGLVVAIKGSRLALGRRPAACLTVRECPVSDWRNDVAVS